MEVDEALRTIDVKRHLVGGETEMVIARDEEECEW